MFTLFICKLFIWTTWQQYPLKHKAQSFTHIEIRAWNVLSAII